MAYVGEVPWHELGYALQPGASIEEWQAAAGMNWEIKSNPLLWLDPAHNGTLHPVPNRVALSRSDNAAYLSTVSSSYQIVQPAQVLEFYRDLVGAAGFELETAGVLFGGRKFWALAKTGEAASIMNVDPLHGYLLLATSCDGSLSTTAQFTSVRVVCNNTLTYSVDGREGVTIRVPHNSVFDPVGVKAQLGIAAQNWEAFIARATSLAEMQISSADAAQVIAAALKLPKLDLDDESGVPDYAPTKAFETIMRLFDTDAVGNRLVTARGTAWGLVNAVTEFVDHHNRAKTADSRLNQAWFGSGAALKTAVFSGLVAHI